MVSVISVIGKVLTHSFSIEKAATALNIFSCCLLHSF